MGSRSFRLNDPSRLRHRATTHGLSVQGPSRQSSASKNCSGAQRIPGLGETIPDENVWAGYVPDKLSYPIRNEMLHYNLGDTFVQYGYALFDDEIGIQSGWLIRFYGSRDFMGIISKFGDAKETFGPIFTP